LTSEPSDGKQCMKSLCALIFAVTYVKCLFNEVLSDVEIRLNLL